ncbi:HpcH/HpaI aldolase/citrate lyase family protein [Caenimonas aquaedulcis]|uniref:CoA ester lyase n=1 Tax=Caenimonas aquaedulcis TaxID=2793270 RepID=A0A931H3W4_9BURK|nr:CoA ester lyase [Caenimonas aquaedulcis]MBG9388005.1 CoA ester lyase [Caenimonas aquaedulcis]
MTSVLDRARSFLFVPASRPERFAKALDSGAGCVIVDLEDAVPPDRKDEALDQLVEQLARFADKDLARTMVRINACGSAWHDREVRSLRRWVERGLGGVMLPKAEAPAALHALNAALGGQARLVPLVESLAGLDAADLLARVPQVSRLAFGHLDFQLDLGMRCGPEEPELAPVRFALVAASRRAGIAAPVDGVTLDTSDAVRTSADAHRSRSFGFGAKLCIHPSQVSAVERVLAPTPEELEWARQVVAEAKARNGEAFSLHGKMVDLPVLRLAQGTLLQNESIR